MSAVVQRRGLVLQQLPGTGSPQRGAKPSPQPADANAQAREPASKLTKQAEGGEQAVGRPHRRVIKVRQLGQIE